MFFDVTYSATDRDKDNQKIANKMKSILKRRDASSRSRCRSSLVQPVTASSDSVIQINAEDARLSTMADSAGRRSQLTSVPPFVVHHSDSEVDPSLHIADDVERRLDVELQRVDEKLERLERQLDRHFQQDECRRLSQIQEPPQV